MKRFSLKLPFLAMGVAALLLTLARLSILDDLFLAMYFPAVIGALVVCIGDLKLSPLGSAGNFAFTVVTQIVFYIVFLWTGAESSLAASPYVPTILLMPEGAGFGGLQYVFLWGPLVSVLPNSLLLGAAWILAGKAFFEPAAVQESEPTSTRDWGDDD